MGRGKYYVRVGEAARVVRVRSSEPDLQIMDDLGAGPVMIQGYETRSGSVVYTVEDHPDWPSDMACPKAAQRLVDLGAFWSDDMRFPARGGLWIFGPGRGYSYDEAAEEAQRLASLL